MKQYKARGYTIVLSTWYERGTTEFQPIATKLAQTQADVMDLSGAPPADAGSVYKELAVQGWKGIKISSSAPAATLVKVGGAAVEDVYMGNAADFGGPTATCMQSGNSMPTAEGAERTGEHPAHGGLGRHDGNQGGDGEVELDRSESGGEDVADDHLRVQLWPGGVRRAGDVWQPAADAGADHRHADQERADSGSRADRSRRAEAAAGGATMTLRGRG